MFEFIKWARSGPRLAISSNPNMVPFEPTPDFPSEPHLFVWVRNVGDAKTTITTFGLDYYESRLLRYIRRGAERGVIIEPAGDLLPRVLEPGEQWSTVVKRSSPVEKARKQGVLLCCVWHTMSRRPARHVVRFEKKKIEA